MIILLQDLGNSQLLCAGRRREQESLTNAKVSARQQCVHQCP